MMSKLLFFNSHLFDQFHSYWESKRNHRLVGGILVAVFLLSVAVSLLHYFGLLPKILSDWISINKYFAIEAAFSLLLLVEVIGLIFALARSVSTSLLKQFEIFSLILLRSSFKHFGNLNTDLPWQEILNPLAAMLSDAFGALIIFVFILLISQILKHAPITSDPVDQTRFILFKKNCALLLFFIFFVSGFYDLYLYFQHDVIFDFFTNFYTILIYNDIFLVLLSLRYSYSYLVVFRNSAFAVATLIIRMALTSPPFFNAFLGIIASIFALATVYFYNKYVIFSLLEKKKSV